MEGVAGYARLRWNVQSHSQLIHSEELELTSTESQIKYVVLLISTYLPYLQNYPSFVENQKKKIKPGHVTLTILHFDEQAAGYGGDKKEGKEEDSDT